MKNLYQVLEISANATPKEIKRAYRKLALIYHPDRPGGSTELMNEINKAYETLSDPETKTEYDLNWSVFQQLDDEALKPVSGYLTSNDASLFFSFAFKREHANLVALAEKQGVTQVLAKTRLTPFKTDIYSYDELIYSDLVAYLKAKGSESSNLICDETPIELNKNIEKSTTSEPNDINPNETNVNTTSNLFTRFFSSVTEYFIPEDFTEYFIPPETEYPNPPDEFEEENMEELNALFPNEFNVDTALNLFAQFLSGHYYGKQLKKLHTYFNKNTATLKKTHVDAPELQVYEAFFTVIDIIVNERPVHHCLAALGGIVSYAKELPQINQQGFLTLFCNPYYRAFYEYVQHEQWHDDYIDLFTSDLVTNFDGYEHGVKKFEALKAQFMDSKDTNVLNTAKHMKLLIKLETALQASSLEQNAADYRAHAFTLLDWIPAIKECLTPSLYANLFIQIGLKFQQASVLESELALKQADEQLALKMYLTAFSVTEKSAPDLSLYVMALLVTFLSQFTCDNALLTEVLPELQKKHALLADVFPCYEHTRSNIELLTQDNKMLPLMRHMLNTLYQRYQYNQTHADGIALEYQETTVLYQIYEACLKNWFMAHYDPQFEKDIRLSLMEELLLDNGWGFLDVEQHLDSDWVMVARDAQGWLQPTDALPLNPQIPSYKRVEGFQVNNQTGNISFFMEPWSPEDEDWERLFTGYDVQEMMVKNLGAAFFSLDPADPDKPYHPFNTMRFAPTGLADSALMDTMLLTDYMLKFMTTGQEVQGTYPFDRQPIENALSHLPAYLCDIIKRYREAEHHGTIHRFWIEAEEINVDTQTDEADTSTSVRLGEMRMVVKKHRMERDIHGELKDVSNEDEGWPIYVLTPAEIARVLGKQQIIPGHAMIFNTESKKVIYWENNTLIKEHETKIIPENMTRLYHQPRINGLVALTSQNTRLLVKLTRDVAKQTKMSHRYSPEFIFAHDLTLHYNEFATYLPEFGRLRELSRLAVMVRMLDSMRVRNNHKINAITALVNPQVNPEDTETYRYYKKAFDSIHQSVTTQTTQIRSSLADIENQKIQTLDALKREHGFTTKSQQEDLVRSLASEFHMASSIIEPLVKQFAAGDSKPLARKLCEAQKKTTLESVIEQLCKNTPGSSRQDFYHALTENQATGDKTIARRVFAEQTRDTLFGYERLQRSYKCLAFAEKEVPEEDNEGVCYWVPASIKHEEKVSRDGLSRYSFFVYGGVNLQARVNVNQNPVSFNRTAITRGFQDHHIVSNKNRQTANHPLWQLSGINPNSRVNKIYLPTQANQHPSRSIHLGRHTNAYSEMIRQKMNILAEKGRISGWTSAQFRDRTKTLLSELRQELKGGNIALNKHHRPWVKK